MRSPVRESQIFRTFSLPEKWKWQGELWGNPPRHFVWYRWLCSRPESVSEIAERSIPNVEAIRNRTFDVACHSAQVQLFVGQLARIFRLSPSASFFCPASLRYTKRPPFLALNSWRSVRQAVNIRHSNEFDFASWPFGRLFCWHCIVGKLLNHSVHPRRDAKPRSDDVSSNP